MQAKKLFWVTHGNEQGQLVALEEGKEVPFQLKRVYYVYDTKSDVARGLHAHKTLQQILVCVHGSCKIMLDDGKEKKIIPLDRPEEGLYVPSAVWREIFDFSQDAVLMVLASDLYDENDYIRDYNEFLEYVSNHEEAESYEK